MAHYGQSLKKVRKNKHLSQQKVATTALSQAAYSNFEAGKSDIGSAAFVHLLNQLQLTFEELDYLQNGCQFGESDHLIQRFFRLPYNNKTEIQDLIRSIDMSLEAVPNNYLMEIRQVCEALLILETSGSLNDAREKVQHVWERISNYDQWYLMDIKLLNAMLYFFDSDTVIPLADKLLERLSEYNGFADAIKLSITIQINSSMILIQNGAYTAARTRLDRLLKKQLRQLPYPSLAVCCSRLAICCSHIDLDHAAYHYDKAVALLKLYEDDHLLQMIQEEYSKYSKPEVV
ncbi:Rgg/GadR/MutR family transcriptional regulator [Sporosarcina trichiuri]|uniref:Rgg/GadR/MutR family transcriptional regulator n=1 Tax=Sporosarcina trichiuri TaxID=3056445 RepID=UPI0025B44B2F|nr:Rgg/GadR/MutR family transcriptional regulator [Sporosarcina sp. 0.2-SM1T-5]WJY26112.1 helix-turn-helix domain-containing protein [Sporosarcina sp. 0.2-SM1T-5]